MQAYLRAQIGFLQEQSKLIAIQISRLSHLESTLLNTTSTSSSSLVPPLYDTDNPTSTVVTNPDDFSGLSNGSMGHNIALSTVSAMEHIPLALPTHPSNYELLKEQLKLEKKTEKARLKIERKLSGHSLHKMEKKLSKKEVDPNKPKKPLTAYLMFSNAEMPKLRAEMAHPSTEFTHKDMMVRLGAKWKALTPEERKMYDDMVEPEITSYHQKLEQYQRMKEGTSQYAESSIDPLSVQFILTNKERLGDDSDDVDDHDKKKRKKKTDDDMTDLDIGDDGEGKKKKKKSKHHKDREEE